MSYPKCQPTRNRSKRQPPQRNSALPPPKPPRDSFQVVIQCESEAQQEELYNEFCKRGMTVRLLTM